MSALTGISPMHAVMRGIIGEPMRDIAPSGASRAMAPFAVWIDRAPDARPFMLYVVATGKLIPVLMRHRKGDEVTVAGDIDLTRFAGQDGKPAELMALIADSLISARAMATSRGAD